MKCLLALSVPLLAAACGSLTPAELAEQVRALPGRQPLRVGVVVASVDRSVVAAAPQPGAAPAGELRPSPGGCTYVERLLLPTPLPEDAVLDAVVDLGAFTDVVSLPLDARGITTREALVQRVQDRVWPLALAQELDAVLVIDGVEDRGLTFFDADEGLFTLDTTLWWLTWPFGVWLEDRSYQGEVNLVARLLWVGDQRPIPQSRDVEATPPPCLLSPWQRAAAPALGLLVPPAWLADDQAAVGSHVSQWTRETLPIELVRHLKSLAPPGPADLRLDLRVAGERLHVLIDSAEEVLDATLMSLPRGALTSPAVGIPIHLRSSVQAAAGGVRTTYEGDVSQAEVRQAGLPLLRLRITLAGGDAVSRTYSWNSIH